MRITYKVKIWILGILAMVALTYSCAKVDEEFVRRTNTISQTICRTSYGGDEFQGAVCEYNANDELMTGSFNQEDIGGGYGLVIFAAPRTLERDIDSANIYLTTTLMCSEAITPSLNGRHSIAGGDTIITVKSGTGTTRRYRVRGYYE